MFIRFFFILFFFINLTQTGDNWEVETSAEELLPIRLTCGRVCRAFSCFSVDGGGPWKGAHRLYNIFDKHAWKQSSKQSSSIVSAPDPA